MNKKALTNPELFKFYDKKNKDDFFGSNQRWFPTTWQRLSGCGSCAASNIYYYLTYLNNTLGKKYNSRKEWVSLMEELWKYVKPSLRGVNKLEMFYNPMLEFAKTKGMDLTYHFCEVPEEVYYRPTFQKVIDFLSKALDKDLPVAFLNWCNGEVKNLDRWHWVTIIELGYDLEKEWAYVNILDEGRFKTIDLALWLKSTKLGGGFLYFEFA
ncbi:MAG: hypothetical protein GX958_12845 [Desulfitobacterium sp.]|nr:hypothetical protein [Desulfitobacterium sp.]